MKHIRKYRLLLAFLLSLILIFEGLPLTAWATESTDPADTAEVVEETAIAAIAETVAPTEAEPADTAEATTECPPEVLTPDLPAMGDIESDVIISPPDTTVGGEVEPMSGTQPLPDGIYSFRNVGNSGRYMDTERDSSSPDAHLQQYAYAESPVAIFADRRFANGGIFKLSYREDLGSYVIRSMTNNLLSYTFSSDGYVITHEIDALDDLVDPEDTFTITRSGGGYVIRSYGQDDCIAAQNTTASGSAGAPDSYLIQSTLSESGNQARWNALYYSNYDTGHQHGYIMEQEPTSCVAGQTGVFKAKTWSTMIDYNSPFLSASPSSIMTKDFFIFNYSLYVNFHQKGTLTLSIYVKHPQNLTDVLVKQLSYTVTLPFDEGIYFIKNREVGHYMQINNNGGNTMEVFPFDGDTDQKWSIEHDADEYYKIRSLENDLYLTVPSDSYDTNWVSLELQAYEGLSGQRWKFTQTDASLNSYVIRPESGEWKTTDWCINVNSGLALLGGLNIVQSDFVNNSSYRDEFVMEPLDEKKIVLCSITNVNHEHLSCLEDIEDALIDADFNNVELVKGTLDPIDCLDSIIESTVFVSRSHAEALYNEETNLLECTGIVLNDKIGDERKGLYSHYSDQMPPISEYIIPATDSFENVEIAVFVGCQTGAGGETGKNLPAILVSQGAEVVIGFKGQIDCFEANDWTFDFFELLFNGYTVHDAITTLNNDKTYANTELSNVTVCGNRSYVLCK